MQVLSCPHCGDFHVLYNGPARNMACPCGAQMEEVGTVAEASDRLGRIQAAKADANARLTDAAADLLAAAIKLEEAEHFHANCEDCEGDTTPELCATCFPLFDDARTMRRAAIAKATGGAS